MKKFLTIVATCFTIAACGGKQNAQNDNSGDIETTDPAPDSQYVPSTDTTTSATTDGFTMPAHYAPMFEADRTWTYEAVEVYRFHDIEHEEADENGIVEEGEAWLCTCAVERAQIFENSAATYIACEDDCDAEWIGGVFVATEDGLFWSYSFPESDMEALSAGTETQIIAAAPQVGETVRGDESMPYTETISRTTSGDWCVGGSFNDGTVHTTEICFRNRYGLATLMSREEVGFTQTLDETTTTFELAQ